MSVLKAAWYERTAWLLGKLLIIYIEEVGEIRIWHFRILFVFLFIHSDRHGNFCLDCVPPSKWHLWTHVWFSRNCLLFCHTQCFIWIFQTLALNALGLVFMDIQFIPCGTILYYRRAWALTYLGAQELWRVIPFLIFLWFGTVGCGLHILSFV